MLSKPGGMPEGLNNMISLALTGPACRVLVFLAIIGIWTLPLQAQGKETVRQLDEKNRRYFTDLVVSTHEGTNVRFYSDLLKDRIVVINFFYTNCPTAQTSLSTLFRVQQSLGDALGKEVVLLSLSVDPERDTVEAVRKYAGKFNPRKGWTFVTGKPQNIEAINLKLGNRNLIPEFHIQVFLLGNLATGQWMRLPETARAEAVVEGVRNLMSSK